MTMYGLRLPDAFGSKRMYVQIIRRWDQTLKGRFRMAIHEVSVNVTHMALPGAFLADVFPVLRWLPDFLAPWRVKATRLHEWEYGVYGGFLNDIISDYKNGTDRPECFVGNYIKARSEHGLEDAPGKGVTSNGWIRDMLLAYSAGNVLEAGSDTTACTIKTVLLFLLSYPQVLEKVRNEIDSVVGPNRLPTVEDEPSLPYLIATIKEVMRCRPAIPLGLPHSPSEDTIYKGHLIPKGSIVIANAYALHMDSVRFPDPKAFKPERWFVCDDKTKPMRWGSGPEQDRDHYLFGWGRRFCPGSHIAEATLFITLSRLIWAFKFQAAGTPPDPWDEESYTAGFVTNPHKFDIKFEPRTATHADVVRRAFEEAQEQWETLGMERDGGVE
ncbi:hypothetical protein PQX77_011755 [Marasmius sp. AFHP31]|nr:hypothetical protein PQX77_011755 [Marasmius sp. AFHP31]